MADRALPSSRARSGVTPIFLGIPRFGDSALCAQTDPEIFFPEKGGSTRPARRICERCPIQPECREYALATDQRHGVWGGLSERDRRRLKGRIA